MAEEVIIKARIVPEVGRLGAEALETAKGGAKKEGGLLGGLTKSLSGTTNKGILAMAGTLGAIAIGITAVVGLLTSASGMFKSVLGGIWKTLKLILKPIGDILSIALMPLLYILKPVGIFFNTLMRPYIRRAMEAMRIGGAFMAQGMPVKATESFALGASYLLKPFLDIQLKAIGFLGEALMNIFAKIFDVIGLGFIGDKFRAVGEKIKGSMDWLVNKGFMVLDTHLLSLATQADVATESTGGFSKSVLDLVNSYHSSKDAIKIIGDAAELAAPKILGLLPDLATIDNAKTAIQDFYNVLLNPPTKEAKAKMRTGIKPEEVLDIINKSGTFPGSHPIEFIEPPKTKWESFKEGLGKIKDWLISSFKPAVDTSTDALYGQGTIGGTSLNDAMANVGITAKAVAKYDLPMLGSSIGTNISNQASNATSQVNSLKYSIDALPARKQIDLYIVTHRITINE